MSLHKKLRYWGITLIIIGLIAALFTAPLVQLFSQSNQDPLAPDIAYYTLNIIAGVGVPLGSGFVAVSFVTLLIREEKTSATKE